MAIYQEKKKLSILAGHHLHWTNRPLKPDEFEKVTGQTVYVSATSAALEIERSSCVAEQLIRPTGLLDPEMERPIKGQVEDCINEIKKVVANGDRILVTTLTKKDVRGFDRFFTGSRYQSGILTF